MSSFATSATEEEAKGPQKGPKTPLALRGPKRKGAECPELLYLILLFIHPYPPSKG